MIEISSWQSVNPSFRVKGRSFFLLGLNADVLEQQRLNHTALHFSLQQRIVARKTQHRWLGIDQEVEFASLVAPTHFPGVDLQEGALSMVKFHFCLPLHEVLLGLVLGHPLAIGVDHGQAEVQNV